MGRTRASRSEVYAAMQEDNPMGATSVGAVQWRQAVRDVWPTVAALGVVPLVAALLFAPTAIEILAKIDPRAPYDPLRAAFVTVELIWAVAAVNRVRGTLRYRKFRNEVEATTEERLASEHEAELVRARRAAERRADTEASRRAGAELYGYRVPADGGAPP